MLLITTTALIALAIATLFAATVTRVRHRTALRSTLAMATAASLTQAGIGEESLDSLAGRVLGSASGSAARFARALTPSGYRATIAKQLALAGRPDPEQLDRHLACRLACLGLIPVAIAFALVLPIPGRVATVLASFLSLVAVLGPDAHLKRVVAKRQSEIRKQLPDLLDLLTISVEAGLGFEQALSRTVVEITGPLRDEFARMLHETRLGMDRQEALERVAERTDVPELRSFLMALNQTEMLGISVVRILRSQSTEIRTLLRLRTQEAAQKAPVKMMFPLVLCILPALFVVVVGPAALQIYDHVLKSHAL